MIRTPRFGAAAARRPALHLWLAFGVLTLGAALALALHRSAAAQPAATLELASAAELEDLVGPIALYPDDLVAIVLPASTYPLQIVQAARFLEDRERDSRLQPDEQWDDSIIALLNYPEVVELLNGDLDWTYDLGTAVLNQRADVLNAIQDFRDRAYAAGNLRSDERQTVAREDGTLVIKPASPQVIYVPYYEPRKVVVYQPVPVYHYYPRRYAVYYYPYPSHYVFDTGFFWGVRSWFSIGWHTHHVHFYDWHYHGHPYYGHRYYDPFYVRNVYVNVNVNRYHDHIWQPRQRYGGRPVVRGYEGRVYTADRAPPRVDRGTAYRTTDGARSTISSEQRVNRESTGAYRGGSVQSTQRAAGMAQARQPAAAGVERSAQPRQPSADRGESAAQPRRGVYRNGSSAAPPAPERSHPAAATGRELRTNPAPTTRTHPAVSPRTSSAVSPRAVERSTGMPRESVRTAPTPRPSAPAMRMPSPGGGMGAQRGESASVYRGSSGGDSGGGSYRGGGSERGASPAARGGEGRARSAAR